MPPSEKVSRRNAPIRRWATQNHMADGEMDSPAVSATGERRMKHRKLFMILAAFAALGFVALVPSTGMAQAKKEICDNGTDDDGDKLVDCQDPDCSADPACKPPPKEGVCHNIGGPDAKGGGAK